MTPARKLRIWEREGGVCWVCREAVEVTGPTVRYDHRGTLYITESDDDAGIFPIHLDPCDKAKTPKDLTRIAKTKRQGKMRLDVPQETRKTLQGGGKLPAKGMGRKMQSRPFPKGQRPLRGRSF